MSTSATTTAPLPAPTSLATFAGNRATGTGANYIDASCHVRNGESGNGGNGGAVVIDGGEDFAVVVCGNVYTVNIAGALAGAFFRTPRTTPTPAPAISAPRSPAGPASPSTTRCSGTTPRWTQDRR